MEEMNEYTPELIELVDDEGNKKNFELIDVELVILKTIEEDGEEILASIDDDEEYLKVSEVFLRRMEETLGEDEDDE